MNRPCILIVDDEPMIRRLLWEFLARHGYDVVEASNGREAVTMASKSSVDLVITDLFMPEQEGIETIRQLRKERPGLKILAMSGAFGGEFLPMVRYLGADNILHKPLRYDDVLRAVRAVLPINTEDRGPAEADASGS